MAPAWFRQYRLKALAKPKSDMGFLCLYLLNNAYVNTFFDIGPKYPLLTCGI